MTITYNSPANSKSPHESIIMRKADTILFILIFFSYDVVTSCAFLSLHSKIAIRSRYEFLHRYRTTTTGRRNSERFYRQIPGGKNSEQPRSDVISNSNSIGSDDQDLSENNPSISLPPWLRLVDLWSSISTATESNPSISSSNQILKKTLNFSNNEIENKGNNKKVNRQRGGALSYISVEELLMGGGLASNEPTSNSSINVTIGTILDIANASRRGLNNTAIIDQGGSADYLFVNMLEKLGDLNDLMKSVLQQQQQPQQKSLQRENSNLSTMNASGLIELNSNDIVLNEKLRIGTGKIPGDQIFDSVTSLLEGFFTETSSVLSQKAIQTLVTNTTQSLLDSAGDVTSFKFLNDTEIGLSLIAGIAKEQGLDMNVATTQAADLVPTLKYTLNLLQFANDVLNEGYLPSAKYTATDVVMNKSRALFRDFDVTLLSKSSSTVVKAAEMAAISGAIYQSRMKSILHEYGHAIVANGTSSDIAWLVTDNVAQPDSNINFGDENEPCLVRTITIRGYDASDENVDRERLVTEVCRAKRAPFCNGIEVHSGLLSIAESLYDDLIVHIDNTSDSHKIVLTGHSIGGSLSNLLLLLLIKRRGVDFVKKRIVKVFTFGSPPIVGHSDPYRIVSGKTLNSDHFCSILDVFGISGSLIQAYIQPWDPIVRLFSELDALYPLVEDLGEDGLTPFVHGPPRTLRPIFKNILESMEVWPSMRENYEVTGSCKFIHMGVPHLILPEKTRYLTDRLVSVNVAVPPIDSIARVQSKELYPLLQRIFPLDEFSISYISVAVRSFIHHFHPAYGNAMEEYALSSKQIEGRNL